MSYFQLKVYRITYFRYWYIGKSDARCPMPNPHAQSPCPIPMPNSQFPIPHALYLRLFGRSPLKILWLMLRSRQRKNAVDKEAVLHGRDRQVNIL
jgi:hypothetical protein